METIGIWSAELRYGDAAASRRAAAELDELGFSALWIPGGVGGDVFGAVDSLLSVTNRTTVATSIVNIWKHQPSEIGRWWRSLTPDHQSRVMLGLGVSHASLIGASYGRPIATMGAFLDGLDAQGVPTDKRCLAAFGPKMLDLARDRSAGAHPYLVTPQHTVEARGRLGPASLLAVGQAVILEEDPSKAHEIARQGLSPYLHQPNYINSWKRLGFSDDDIENVSSRFCDGLFAWGGMGAIAERVNAHLDAGANHVCLKVVRGYPGGDATELSAAWRSLAQALL